MKDELMTTILGVALAFVIPAMGPMTVRASVIAEDRSIQGSNRKLEWSDFVINHSYNVGNHDGLEDHMKKQVREHYRNFRNDDARRAYEEGYQSGRAGERSHRMDQPQSNWARVRSAHTK